MRSEKTFEKRPIFVNLGAKLLKKQPNLGSVRWAENQYFGPKIHENGSFWTKFGSPEPLSRGAANENGLTLI